LGQSVLPDHTCKFSRRDFTLPQLFACLVLREFHHLSFRRTEALLRDCPDWLLQIGLARAPDHNTLWRAFEEIVRVRQMDSMLDVLAAAFAAHQPEALKKPLAFDGSCYEIRHVSRYFERRCQETRKRKHPEKTARQRRSEAVRRLPKMGIAAASGCHLIVAARTLTGGGPDLPLFAPLLEDASRRGPFDCVVADAGFDSEESHRLAHERFAIASIIPPTAGRPTGKAATGAYRRRMQELFASGEVDEVYGQRWQVETVHSMIKRNQGSALRAMTQERREREMFLRIITHNVMLAKRYERVETEQLRPRFEGRRRRTWVGAHAAKQFRPGGDDSIVKVRVHLRQRVRRRTPRVFP
jgi:hypothetical protein